MTYGCGFSLAKYGSNPVIWACEDVEVIRGWVKKSASFVVVVLFVEVSPCVLYLCNFAVVGSRYLNGLYCVFDFHSFCCLAFYHQQSYCTEMSFLSASLAFAMKSTRMSFCSLNHMDWFLSYES